ncbi:CQI_4a_G0000070.mRNA.1.CDS.1 [Saccharomyces cerevisiae]|nr:CQI_4a_G0000070.mRNA.1.CDS.1 [Saccharomyces cerevisiae]CAI7124208.1 CQI_4a_G0000070.mRNA.1.CDS.1 [Saccharomyces cerevisiae]
MLAKTGDVVVQKVPVIRLSVFLHFFFVFPFCLLHRLYMGMKQVQEFIMEPKGSVFVVRATLRVSLENAGKIFFNETDRDPRKRERAPSFTGTFVSHVSAENNCRPRRSEITQPCASGTERSILRLRRNSALTLSRGSRKDFLSLPLGHSYLFLFCFWRMICSEPKL